jgi:polysaccharide export outer membrane protein
VKTLWAVACAASVALLSATIVGCASAPKKADDFAVAGASASLGEGGTATVEAASAAGAGGGTASPVSAAPVVLSGPAYRIGPEDVLRVSVWGNQELTLDVTVRPDGKISVPLVQDVQAEGLTAAELSDVIHNRLQPYIKEPQVSVIVSQVNAPKIFVLGSVTRPGPYPLRSEMSVLQALSLAGGFTQFAAPKSIKIVRNFGGKQEVRRVNYYDMIDDGEGNYLLKPGDTIVVP